MIRKRLLSVLIMIFFCGCLFSQNTSIYKYDAKGRIIMSSQKCITHNYYYDNDGNRNIASVTQIQIESNINEIRCPQDNGAISLTGSELYSYSWSSGQTGAFIQSLSPGIYTVTITDGNDNICVHSFILNEPDSINISISQYMPSCYGYNNGSAVVDTSNLQSDKYSFLWSNGTQGILTNNLSAGLYSLTVTDNASSCTKIIPFTISEPASKVSAINVNQVSCYGMSDGFASILLSGSQTGTSVSWSNGVHGNAIGNLMAGTYYVTVTDEGTGCIEDTAVYIPQPAALHTTAEETMPDCDKEGTGKIMVSAMGGTQPYQYSINFGTHYQSSSLFQNLEAGTYYVFIRDAHYCLDTVYSVMVNYAQAINGLPIEYTGQLLNSPYGVPNYWYVVNNPIPIGQGNAFECSEGTVYYVKGIDNNGCIAKSAEYTCGLTHIDQMNPLASFTVYPSPNKGEFLVEFTCTSANGYSIEINDGLGRSLAEFGGECAVDKLTYPISLNTIAAGIYYVRLRANGGVAVKAIEVIK